MSALPPQFEEKPPQNRKQITMRFSGLAFKVKTTSQTPAEISIRNHYEKKRFSNAKFLQYLFRCTIAQSQWRIVLPQASRLSTSVFRDGLLWSEISVEETVLDKTPDLHQESRPRPNPNFEWSYWSSHWDWAQGFYFIIIFILKKLIAKIRLIFSKKIEILVEFTFQKCEAKITYPLIVYTWTLF